MHVCVCVCVCMFLLLVSDRAVSEGSKYFELGRQLHECFNLKYLFYDSDM